MALVKDRDGSGSSFSPANGVAFGRITVGNNNIVRINNPGGLNFPVIITGAPTDNFTGLAISSSGAIYAVQRVGSTDQLDQLTVTGPGGGSTVASTPIGTIALDNEATNTQLLGIGFDENGNLVGMNSNGANSELVGINIISPIDSVRLDAPGLIQQPLAGFAMGKSGATFKSYAYTTDSVNGGSLFTNPGIVSTLGRVDSNGGFTELLPLTQDISSTPLANTVVSVADDGAGHIFVITNNEQVFEYLDNNGALIGGGMLGTVEDVSGVRLDINRLAFDGSGRLIGLSSTGDNLVQISTNTSVVDGLNVLFASNLTEGGTVDNTDLKALMFSPTLGQFISYSSITGNFVAILGTSPETLGGLVANSFGAVNLLGSFGGRISATGNGALNAIDTVKITGAGTFTGSIQSDVGIGAVTGTGITFAGAIVSHGNVSSIVLTGTASTDAVIAVDGMLTTLTYTGSFDGTVLAGRATNITFNGTVMNDALVEVVNDISGFTISGRDSGTVLLGTSKTIKVGGLLAAPANFSVLGDAGAITLSGGTQLGSEFLVDQGATSITIGGTLTGTVAIRRNLGTATLGSLSNGVFEAGGNITSLNINGSVNHSILGSGIWVGQDGIYNTADDVIFGGSIDAAKINGGFTDSLITAGVLPRVGILAGANNIPTTFGNFKQNLQAINVDDVDSTEAGGISKSSILSITFAKPVVSSNPGAGLFSALIAADSISKVNATGDLQQLLRNDPPGAPVIVTSTDPTTGAIIPGIQRFGPGEIRITFDEPLDTSTINSSTISVVDPGTGTQITDLTFNYLTQTAADGSTQGVIQIISPSNFGGAGELRVTLKGGIAAPTIADQTGLRSALLDYNQDGVLDPTGDPFGTTLLATTQLLDVGAPLNDNFNSATIIAGLPILVQGTNVNATLETGEPTHGGDVGGSSVWWSWTAPFSGGVTVSTDGSDFDTLLSVYSGTSEATIVSVGENDDDGGPNGSSAVSFNALIGQTYKIAVDGFNGNGTADSGHIVLSINKAAAPPANDNFANAAILTGATASASESTFLASAETGEPAHDGVAASASVWWKWTAPAAGTYVVDTNGSDFSNTMSVYTSTASTPTLATLISRGENAGLTASSVVINATAAGITYYIAIDSRTAAATGDVVLNINPATIPANDNFANAIPIVGIPVSVQGSNVLATKETGEPSDGGAGTHSVWWSWTAPATEAVQIQTTDSSIATQIGVFTGTSVATLTPIASSTAGLVTIDAIAGETYMISVDGIANAQGIIVLEILPGT